MQTRRAHIFCNSEVEKVIKAMMNKKATRDDDVLEM
jgi:hypothetical protein